MLRGRRFPVWLVRRGYFKRIARWAKHDRPEPRPPAPEREPEAEPVPSNVLPFPVRSGAARQAGGRVRGVGAR